MVDPVEDGAKLAVQGDGEVATHWFGGNDDAIDDLADGFGCLKRVVGVCKRGGQALDPAPVGSRDA